MGLLSKPTVTIFQFPYTPACPRDQRRDYNLIRSTSSCVSRSGQDGLRTKRNGRNSTVDGRRVALSNLNLISCLATSSLRASNPAQAPARSSGRGAPWARRGKANSWRQRFLGERFATVGNGPRRPAENLGNGWQRMGGDNPL